MRNRAVARQIDQIAAPFWVQEARLDHNHVEIGSRPLATVCFLNESRYFQNQQRSLNLRCVYRMLRLGSGRQDRGYNIGHLL